MCEYPRLYKSHMRDAYLSCDECRYIYAQREMLEGGQCVRRFSASVIKESALRSFKLHGVITVGRICKRAIFQCDAHVREIPEHGYLYPAEGKVSVDILRGQLVDDLCEDGRGERHLKYDQQRKPYSANPEHGLEDPFQNPLVSSLSRCLLCVFRYIFLFHVL